MSNYFSKIKYILFLVFLQTSFAGDFGFPDLFNPESSKPINGTGEVKDFLVREFIDKIYGTTGGSIQAISQLFLQGILVVGSFLLMYNILTGVSDTGNIGKLMGDRHSLKYTVLRAVIGISAIIPVNKGFSAIQIIILYLAVQGVYAGAKVWEAFVDANPIYPQIVINNNLERKLLVQLKPVILSEVCRLKMEEAREKDQKQNSNAVKWIKTVEKTDSNTAKRKLEAAKKTLKELKASNTDKKEVNRIDRAINNQDVILTIGYGADQQLIGLSKQNQDISEFSLSEKLCGAHRLITKDQPSSFTNPTAGSLKEKFQAIQKEMNGELSKQISQIQETHRVFFEEMLGRGEFDGGLTNIAQDLIYRKNSYSIASSMVTLLKRYKLAIIRQAESANNFFKANLGPLSLSISNGNENNTLKLMKEQGIASAGVWFWTIVSQGDTLSSYINEVPNISTVFFPNYNGKFDNKDSNLAIKELRKYNNAIGAQISNAEKIYNDVLILLLDDAELEDGKNSSFFENNTYSSNRIMGALLGNNSGALSLDDMNFESDLNPMVQVHNIGIKFLQWIEGFMSKIQGDNSFSSGGIITFISVFVAALIPALIMVFYLPMLPFIIWVGAVVGWMVLVMQAIFGAPLWMLAHLNPAKDGFVGNQKRGYVLIMSLTLRPMLMIAGYGVALFMLYPVGQLINTFYSFAASSILGGKDLLWLVGILAITIIYAVVLQNAVKKIFGLIHVIPDTILEWFAEGNTAMLGQYANEIENGASGGFNQIAGGLSGAASGIANKAAYASRSGSLGSGKAGSLGSGGATSTGSGGNGAGIMPTMEDLHKLASLDPSVDNFDKQSTEVMNSTFNKSGYGTNTDLVHGGGEFGHFDSPKTTNETVGVDSSSSSENGSEVGSGSVGSNPANSGSRGGFSSPYNPNYTPSYTSSYTSSMNGVGDLPLSTRSDYNAEQQSVFAKFQESSNKWNALSADDKQNFLAQGDTFKYGNETHLIPPQEFGDSGYKRNITNWSPNQLSNYEKSLKDHNLA